ERRDLGPRDVAIDIAYAGICHSDIHQVREEWGGAIFPMVPGYEIAGTVGAVGAEVEGFAVGDRVGVGCVVASCRECEYCLGADHYVATSEAGAYEALRNTFDLIINTVSADVDVDALARTLRVGGSLVYVGAPSERQSFAVFSLIGGRRSIAGSNIGGIRET